MENEFCHDTADNRRGFEMSVYQGRYDGNGDFAGADNRESFEMSAFGGRYDGNGDFAGASPPARTGAFDGFAGGDDRSQSERRSSRSRDRDREREKDRGRNDDRDRHRSEGRGQDRERERDHDRHRSRDRDRERGRSHGRDHDYDLDRERERGHDRHRSRDRDRERGISHGRDRDRGRDDYDRSHTRDYDRHRARDREREGHHGHRSRSRTRGESEHRSKSRSRPGSRSRSKSKRISGFDMAPPQNAPMVSGVVAQGLLPGAPAAIPGFFPNMLNIPVQQLLMPQAMTQQATRHARRVYVGGLSPSANEQSIAAFFSQVMAVIGGNTAGPGDPVVNVYINHDKKFAFVEMRSVEEASNAMALDGIIFEGAPVKVRRPTDYNPSLAAALGPSQPNPNLNLTAVGLKPGSAGGLEGPDRIFVGGLPYYFTEAQVRELLESFGPLRGFDLVKDRETGNSKGYAFCVYQDLSVTDIACAALNGIKMGDKTLTVRRANQGAVQPRPEQEIVLQQAQQQVALQRMMFQPGSAATKVVCLANVVDADELKEEESYEDIMEDMRLEAEKYGKLVNLVIPRPGPNGEAGPGVGKVFLEYADTDGAMKAKQALHGRKFGGKLVNAVFFAENKLAQGEYE